jgi:hypothetical protein
MNVYRLAANGVIACTSSLSLAGCSIGLITMSPAAAQVAAPAAKTPAPAAVAGQSVPAGASPSVRGGLYFQIMTTSGTARTIPVIAWGLFTAAGMDHEDKDGVVHTFAFPGGTFQLRYRPGSPVGGSGDPSTCLSTGSSNGNYTLSGGTGKYRRISGSGHYTLNIVEIQAKVNGACSQSRPPVAFQQVITASGPASLP